MDNGSGGPTTIAQKASLYGCGALMFLPVAATIVTFLVASVTFWSIFLPFWAALVLGIPLGFGAFRLCIIGETTLMEMAVKCIVLLILASILLPVFRKARDKAHRRESVKVLKRPIQSEARPTVGK